MIKTVYIHAKTQLKTNLLLEFNVLKMRSVSLMYTSYQLYIIKIDIILNQPVKIIILDINNKLVHFEVTFNGNLVLATFYSVQFNFQKCKMGECMPRAKSLITIVATYKTNQKVLH